MGLLVARISLEISRARMSAARISLRFAPSTAASIPHNDVAIDVVVLGGRQVATFLN